MTRATRNPLWGETDGGTLRGDALASTRLRADRATHGASSGRSHGSRHCHRRRLTLP